MVNSIHYTKFRGYIHSSSLSMWAYFRISYPYLKKVFEVSKNQIYSNKIQGIIVLVLSHECSQQS